MIKRLFLRKLQFEYIQKETGISLMWFKKIFHSPKKCLRGLHFQKGKYAQANLFQFLEEKLDIVVDIRPKSLNFGKWIVIF